MVGDVDKKSVAAAFMLLHAPLVTDAGLRSVVASIETSD